LPKDPNLAFHENRNPASSTLPTPQERPNRGRKRAEMGNGFHSSTQGDKTMQVKAIARSQLHSRYHWERWGQLLCVLSVCLSLLAGMPSAVAAAEEVTEISAQQSLPVTQKVQSSQTDSSAEAADAAVGTPVYHQEAYIKAPVNFSGLEFGSTIDSDGDTVEPNTNPLKLTGALIYAS